MYNTRKKDGISEEYTSIKVDDQVQQLDAGQKHKMIQQHTHNIYKL